MQIGDNVWVEVSRDRERIGKISYVPGIGCIYQVDMETGGSMAVHKSKVRLASDPVAPMKIDNTLPEGATKNDSEKNRLELIPVSGIEGIGRAMTYGSKKYADNNWAKGFDWLRLCGSALRHLLAFMSGQDDDPESGLSHLDHFGACAVMLIAHKEEGLGNDNRRKTNV